MKGLDTSTLVALLHGNRTAKDLVARNRGVELATTEMNMIELCFLSSRCAPRNHSSRRKAVELLRRRLSVLPIGNREVGEASRKMEKLRARVNPYVIAMLATFEANGCDEIFTFDPLEKVGRWRFRVTTIGNKTPRVIE